MEYFDIKMVPIFKSAGVADFDNQELYPLCCLVSFVMLFALKNRIPERQPYRSHALYGPHLLSLLLRMQRWIVGHVTAARWP